MLLSLHSVCVAASLTSTPPLHSIPSPLTDGSQGRVYVFDYTSATDKWQHFQTIEAEREFSNFGFDVDINRGTIVVGANGYRVDRSGNVLFENKAEFWGWQRSPGKCIQPPLVPLHLL
jgi:hypothetical protein